MPLLLIERILGEGEESGDCRVLVTSKDYEMVWESCFRYRQRAQSILRAQKERTSIMPCAKAEAKAQDSLDAAIRLRVQAQTILTTEPRPTGVTEDPGTKTLRFRVPETSSSLFASMMTRA
jgi:hypothetical protein